MSVAGDIIDDLKFDRTDKVRAITGVSGVFAASIFVAIGIFNAPKTALAHQIEASGVLMEKASNNSIGGVQTRS